MNQDFRKVYILLGLAAILWGVQPVIVKSVLQELSPLMIACYRYIAISIILLAYLFITEGKEAVPSRRNTYILILMGFFGIAINNVFQFSGLQYSTVINCTLVSSTTPAMTALLAAVYLRERLIGLQWIGIMMSFLGVIFLVTHGSVDVLLHLSFNYGDLLFLGSQAGWAIYAILSRIIMNEMTPLATTAWSSLIGAIMTGLLAWWNGDFSMPPVSVSGMLSLSYMIFLGGILAMTWWNYGVQKVGPGPAAVFINIMPVVGMISAVFFLHESLGWQEFFGALWILFGVSLTSQNQLVLSLLNRCHLYRPDLSRAR